MIKVWVMLVCISDAQGPCHDAALADDITFPTKHQCEQKIHTRDPLHRFVVHCEEITVTVSPKYPPAGTPCVILGSPDAAGVYDEEGNCVVPFKFTRPDGIARQPEQPAPDPLMHDFHPDERR